MKAEGHTIKYYGTTYESKKQEELLADYKFTKCKFVPEYYSLLGGGDLISYENQNISIMAYMYLLSLAQLEDEPLDLIISTRFDLDFKINPFKELSFDFNKFNFLFKDSMPGSPDTYRALPMVCDTFYVFKPTMLQAFYNAILESNLRPYDNICIGLLNMYRPLVKYLGEDAINIVCDGYMPSDRNSVYELSRYI